EFCSQCKKACGCLAYKEFDHLKSSKKFTRPWEAVAVPKINRWRIGSRSTVSLMVNFISELYVATETNTPCKVGVINNAPKKSPAEKVHISMQMPKLYPTVPPKFKGDVFGITVYKSDFDSLNENMELTDATLDAFLVLVQRKALERNLYVYTMPANLLSFACHDSSMIEKFDAPYFVDLWLVRTQINGNHWILFIVFVGRKHIMILDSMDRSGVISGEKEARLKMLMYLLNLSHTVSLKQPLQVKDWHVYVPRDVSIQKNSVDCGLIVCLWAYLLCGGK
ncbi:Sentrin-specific protease 1, partial [Frankliniella fusca]